MRSEADLRVQRLSSGPESVVAAELRSFKDGNALRIRLGIRMKSLR